VWWDGYVYPWTFSVHDFEPITGRIHQPPPSQQTLQGRTSSSARSSPKARQAVPIPYHHSNLQSEEMIYYVSGKSGSRKGVEVGSVTLHPSGKPRATSGPGREVSRDDGDARARRHVRHTFYPLKLTKFAKDLDDGKYAYTWYEEPGAPATADDDPGGVTSHF
jgi:homogentisate 1,2-dioxygenase